MAKIRIKKEFSDIYNKLIIMAKRNLKLDVDGLLDAMKEAYRDCDEQKKSILEKYSTISKDKNNAPTDFGDEMEMTRVFNDSRKLINEIIDKKIKLIQIHTKIVMTNKPERDGEDINKMPTISHEEMKALREEILSDMQKESTYDLTE